MKYSGPHCHFCKRIFVLLFFFLLNYANMVKDRKQSDGNNGVQLRSLYRAKDPEVWLSPVYLPASRPSSQEMAYDNPGFTDSEGVAAERGEGNEEATAKSSIRKCLSKTTRKIEKIRENHSTKFKITLLIIFLILYNVYVGFAIKHDWNATQNWCDGARFLIIVTIFMYIIALYQLFFVRYALPPLLTKCWLPMSTFFTDVLMKRLAVKIFLYLLPIAGVAIFLAFDTVGNRNRLISAGGVAALILFGFIFSKHPTKVKWRPVVWGLLLQFLFGLLILRWSVGKSVFQCFGDKISKFLAFTDAGSSFLFGYLVTGQFANGTEPADFPEQSKLFAFKILPVIIFFSFFTSILYHLGIMQAVVKKIGWLLNITVGTTAVESLNAAGNIFVGQTEAPLLIAPFIKDLTKSELHAVMTGGFATIAGTVLAAYINFGVDASHLLSASVMSAPAALGFSKLFYPETEQSKTTADDIQMDKGTAENALEAGAKGASDAISLVANIGANLIAFLAFISFLNSLLMWFGGMVGYPLFNFTYMLSKVFIPLAYVMGVEWADCEHVATLIGLKTIVNEFVAYSELGKMIKLGTISKRSETIATYALCGFSNLSSIGIQLGGLGALAPSRKADLAKVALRSMIAGSVACFLTACIAGALINDPTGESALKT